MAEGFVISPPARPSVRVAGSDRLFPIHRIYCVGRNYAAHAVEMGGDPQREPPFFFSKPADAATQAVQLSYPPRTHDLHHEVELVAVLGRGGRNIAPEKALEHVFGYAVGVDLTRRDLQTAAKGAGRPWDTAKGFDASAPISEIRPASEIGHPTKGAIELRLDGQLRQQGDLADMIWSVAEVIAELSTYFELWAGDMVFTGTPQGVGAIPPGGRIVASIAGIGSLEFALDRVEG